MKRKYLVFLDIDGTLLDYKYKSNCPDLKFKIRFLQEQGNFVFCLNSNRSIQDLLPVAKQFSIEGPLVCENGIFVYFPESKKEILLISQKNTKAMGKIVFLFRRWITLSEGILNKKIFYKNTDTVKLISDGNNGSYPNNTILVFNNKFRKYTISAHVKHIVSGKMVKDLSSLRKLQKVVINKIEQLNLDKIVKVGGSATFGNILIYSNLIDKRNGVEYLYKKYFSDYKIIAIGDESSDAEMVQGLGEFYAVGNATNEANKLAKKVAKGKYAKGVYELIKRL